MVKRESRIHPRAVRPGPKRAVHHAGVPRRADPLVAFKFIQTNYKTNGFSKWGRQRVTLRVGNVSRLGVKTITKPMVFQHGGNMSRLGGRIR